MRSIGILIASIMLVGCGASGEGQVPGSTTTTNADQTTSTIEVTTTMQLPEGLSQDVIEDMLADASERTGVPGDDIEVISIERQTFSDASLGCPEPGKMYAQVLTDGFVVLVGAGGEELDYRVAASGRDLVLCE